MNKTFWRFAATIFVTSFVTSIVSNAAFAAMLATAVTDLNVRSGPGPEYPVIGFIQARASVNMVGCIEGSLWCRVENKGNEGWAYSQYLETQSAGNRIILSERRPDMVVPIVTYNAPPGVAIAPGAVNGALVAGPVGAAIDPPQQVRTYVTTNPGEPVYLNGEVVVGAQVPDTVQLRPVPDYNYRYGYVNRQPVLVDPASRRIVYVDRSPVVERTAVGTLTCDVAAGIGLIIASKKNVACMFTPQAGPRELYRGSITKFGLDIGITAGGEMVWNVIAPTTRGAGALAGSYEGASAEATVGLGVGAKVLVGGSQRTVTLQPVSVQGQAGLNLAVGVAALELHPER